MSDDFKKLIDAAAASAAATADATSKVALDLLLEQANTPAAIFRALKLTDAQTYDDLIHVVDAATRKNEAIGSVVERLQNLGKVGAQLATQVANLSGPGAVAGILSLLGSIRDERSG